MVEKETDNTIGGAPEPPPDPLLQERRQLRTRRIRTFLLAVVIGLCGVSLSLAIAHLQYKREYTLAQDRYHNDVDDLNNVIREYFDKFRVSLLSLQAFSESGETVDSHAFEYFSKTQLKLHENIVGVVRFDYVPEESKASHLDYMQQFDTEYQIIKNDQTGKSSRKFYGYAPLTQAVFRKQMPIVRGKDCMPYLIQSLTNTEVRLSRERAIVIPAGEFLKGSLETNSFILALPKFKQKQITGWVGAILRITDLPLRTDYQFNQLFIQCQVEFDYKHGTREIREVVTIGQKGPIDPETPFQKRSHDLGQLSITCRYAPTTAYNQINISTIPRTLFLAGLLITLLTTGYFIAFLQRHQNLEMLVKFRTMEMLQTNDLLRKEIAEKTQYENALEESQTLYQSLVNELPLMIYRTDLDGRFKFTNRAFERYFGLTEEELYDRLPVSVLPEKVGSRLQNEDQRVLASRQSSQHVQTMRDTTGKEHHFEIRKTALHDSFNKVTGVQAAFWDVTSREHARIAQRDLETRYHTMIENLPLNFFRKDLEGRFVFASTNVCEDLQRTPHELAGLTDFDIFPDELAEKYQRDDQQVMNTGMPLHTIEKYLKKDEERFVEVVKTPVRDHLGNIVGVQGAYWDVTEKQEAETERRRLANIVASSKDAIFSTNREGMIQIWNPGANSMYGFDPEEVIDHSSDLFIPEEARAEFHKAVQGVIKGRFSLQLESQHMHRTGKLIDVALAISPIVEAKGDINGVSVISRDITVRKQAQNKLEQTARALERSNNELKEFAYVASHDLQEPLRMIASYCQLLEAEYAEKLDDDGKRFINYAVDGAKRMQTLIRDLLTYSRVDTTGKDLEDIRLSQVFEVAIKNLSVLVNETKTTIKMSDDLPTIKGDFTQLVQLVQNLINNGIKFRGEKAACIEITHRIVRDQVYITIRDNGIGIATEYQSKIFQIFKRLHTREEYEGTGIGLAVCKRVVERHGGTITVDSDPGKGAAFTFNLNITQ